MSTSTARVRRHRDRERRDEIVLTISANRTALVDRLIDAHLLQSDKDHDHLGNPADVFGRTKEIMRVVGRDVCNGLEIGVDVDQLLKDGARYRDKRPVAKKMWATMMSVLQDVGALQKGPLP